MNRHRPRRRFGQNFLHDPGTIARIVDAINPKPGERVLEIGPGQGALTRPLLARGAAVVAVEIDRDLAGALETEAWPGGTLTVINRDALTLALAPFAADGPLRVVGNLPYNISTPLLFHLLGQHEHIADMHFMLQREVVARMVAAPGSRTYGRLSVMLGWHCWMRRLFGVAPGAFRPPPKVHSAVVRLVPRTESPCRLADPALYARVVNTVFSQRRKTLHNALQRRLDADEIRACDIDPEARPETLSMEDYARLTNALHDKGLEWKL